MTQGLLPAAPYMPRGPQPGCIVQCAAPDAEYAIPRHSANPGTAFGANQSGINAPAIGSALKSTRLNSGQVESLFGDDDPQRERASGQALAIQTMAGIDCLRLLGDLVADLPTLAPARLWKLHGPS